MLKFVKLKLTILLIFTLFLFQCKKDFEVNDNWKDITVVYGLLNSKDSVHYIRLTKAFLGNQDAYQMAQVSDSLYYKNASVSIQEVGTNNIFTFTKDSSIQRDSGIFAFDKNIYYKTVAVLNPDAEYKLNISVGSKEITSQTSLIKDFPFSNVPGLISLYSENTRLPIEWTTPMYARLFEPVVRFFYYDITSSDTIKQYIDLQLSSMVSKSSSGGETMNTELSGKTFLSTLGNRILTNTNIIKRIAAKGSIEIRISVGSDDLYTYTQVSQPATGIVTEKPSFSNITGADVVGLFTSTYLKVFPAIKPPLNYRTIDSLAKGRYTKNLKFLNYNEIVNTWSNFP